MKPRRLNRLGGIWHLPVPLMDGERLLRAELASLRRLAYVGLPVGRIYLTTSRIIWSPSFIFSWLRLVRETVAIPLSSIQECSLERDDYFLYTLVVRAQGEVHQFYLGWSLWKRAALEWRNEIERALRAAKEPD